MSKVVTDTGSARSQSFAVAPDFYQPSDNVAEKKPKEEKKREEFGQDM